MVWLVIWDAIASIMTSPKWIPLKFDLHLVFRYEANEGSGGLKMGPGVFMKYTQNVSIYFMI